MHLRNDRHVGAAFGGLYGRAHTGKSTADNDDVVLDH
jgi:hypothetical protein